VGESGSGKSTTARLELALETPDAGEVRLSGRAWTGIRESRRRRERHRIAVVSQDPLSSFDPRWTVEQILRDALDGTLRPAAREARIRHLLELVALDVSVRNRLPLTLSGGQRQRVAIARAIATGPDLIVLDEAVSALDVSVRGKILELLVGLQREHGIAYIFVSHDLAVVRAISHHIAIMDAGRIVEHGPTLEVVADPQSATGRALVAAVPRLVLT
jgi:peptide/nickel transport system ATP-binding protein